jgi:uncharacterized protein (TIGR00269 family)
LTGHTLDDEVQTMVMNFLRGDPVRMLRQHPRAPMLSRMFVHRVKPLRVIYEWEVAMYAYLKGYKFQERSCPYISFQPTLRARVRRWLYRLEGEKPGTMLSMLEKLDNELEKRLAEIERLPELPRCIYCGEPTSYGRSICKVCEMLMEIGIKPSYGF